MTLEEQFKNHKARGGVVYRCRHCSFRGIGAATFYHELQNLSHVTYNEETEKNSDVLELIKNVNESEKK